MHARLDPLIEHAVASFDLLPPFYEFEYRPPVEPVHEADSAGAAAGPEFAGGEPDWNPHDWTRTDRVEDLTRLPFPNGAARTVICNDALKHVARPSLAVAEMLRILAPGGILILTASLRPFSRSAARDSGELTPQSLERMLLDLDATVVGWYGLEQAPHRVVGVGSKAPIPDSFLRGVNEFISRCQRDLEGTDPEPGWLERLKHWLGWRLWSTEQYDRRRNRVGFAVHLPGRDMFGPSHGDGQPGAHKGVTRLDLSQ